MTVPPLDSQARYAQTRRLFLRTVLGSTAALLAACSRPAPAAPTSAPAPTVPASQAQATAPASAGGQPAATAAPAVPKAAAAPSTTLTAGGESIGDNFDPGVSFQGWAHTWVSMNVFDRLLENADAKTLTPGLAESWNVSPDGLTYTFNLRRGVKFHDGTPFNADAVVFNYMRMIDDKHPFYNQNAVFRSNLFLGVKEWKATGEYQVQMTREYPSAAQLTLMSHYAAGFLSPDSIKKAPEDYGRSPVGTGAFKFVEGIKGTRATLEGNPDNWKPGEPKVGRLVIRVVPDDPTMSAGLQTGEIDATPFIDFKDIQRLQSTPNLKVDLVPAINLGFLGINSLKPPLDKPEARKALSQAINRQQIIDVVLAGQGDVAGGYYPKASWAYAPDLANYYPFDQSRAKQLLADAGLPSGFEMDIWVQTSGFWPRMAELIQADLAAVGIRASINKIDGAKFFGAIGEGNHFTFLSDTTPGTMDPEEMVASFFQSASPRAKGRFGYGSKTFDDLLEQQAKALDQDKRKQVFQDIQKLLLDDVAVVNLYYGRFAAAYNTKVQGYAPSPLRTAYFQDVSKTA